MKKRSELQVLRELVETQRKLIDELEKRPNFPVNQPFISAPSVWQVRCSPGPCLYEPFGTSGGAVRHCKICGQQEVPSTVTCTVQNGVLDEEGLLRGVRSLRASVRVDDIDKTRKI